MEEPQQTEASGNAEEKVSEIAPLEGLVTDELPTKTEVENVEESPSPLDLIESLKAENFTLRQQNLALTQENLELRNQILELQSLKDPNPPEPKPEHPEDTGSNHSYDPEPKDTQKKPELEIEVAQLRSMPSISADVLRFFDCFEKFSYDNDTSKEFRKKQWSSLDSNGSGHVSLAETTRWIKTVLYQVTKNKEEGEKLYRLFYPSYIRAFNDAADAGSDRRIKGNSKATEADYIQKGEFRLLSAYLCIYALMLDVFAFLDGSRVTATSVFRADHKSTKTSPQKPSSGRGVSPASSISSISGDRRLTVEEWTERIPSLGGCPFVALNTMTESPQATFSQIDSDGKGAILFIEFCRWVKEREISNDTAFGRLLRVGDRV